MPSPKKSTVNTANDALVTQAVTDEQIAQFDLSSHLIRLMWKEPFFARILRGIQKTRTEEIPTAGVLAKDGEAHASWPV